MKIYNNYALLGLLFCISNVQAEWIWTDLPPPGLGPFSTTVVSTYTDPAYPSETCSAWYEYEKWMTSPYTTFMHTGVQTLGTGWFVPITIDGVPMSSLTFVPTKTGLYTYTNYLPYTQVTATFSYLFKSCGQPSSATSSSAETFPTGSSATTSTVSIHGNCDIEEVEQIQYSFIITPTAVSTFSINTAFSYQSIPYEGVYSPYTIVYVSYSTTLYITTVDTTMPTTMTSVYTQTVCETSSSFPDNSTREPSSRSQEVFSSSIVSSTGEPSTPTSSSSSSIPLTSAPVTASSVHSGSSYSYSYVYVTTYINDCAAYASMSIL